MKRLVLCFFLLVAVMASCARRARIIPAGKFQRIYAEMFLADQWLETNRQFRKTADTTLFYESIFRHYGYDLNDYYASVDYYMDHPDRYQKIIDGSIKWLNARCRQAESLRSGIQKLQAERDALDFYADSSQNAELMAYIDSMLRKDSLALRALMDSVGFHLPDSLVPVDTLLRDTVAVDSVKKQL